MVIFLNFSQFRFELSSLILRLLYFILKLLYSPFALLQLLLLKSSRLTRFLFSCEKGYALFLFRRFQDIVLLLKSFGKRHLSLESGFQRAIGLTDVLKGMRQHVVSLLN